MIDSLGIQGRLKSHGVCQLCGDDLELRDSHVLPAFAFRWLKETSGNGHIRSSGNPNLRVQDGLKHHWLCATCESSISVFEGAFAEKLFRPYLANPTCTVHYRDWLMQFCISVSWRVLLHFKSIDNLGRFSESKRAAISEAARIWRECLLGIRPHPEQFQQHILPVDRVASTTAELAPNINRYLMRAIDMDLCQGET